MAKTISDISQIRSFTDKDKMLVQTTMDGFVLTEKSPVLDLENFFLPKTIITNLKQSIAALNQEIYNIPIPYATKTDFENATTKEGLSSLKESLLTDATMKSKLTEYATENKLKEVQKFWKESLEKSKDEMTDFCAAALMGVVQSAAMMGGVTEAKGDE